MSKVFISQGHGGADGGSTGADGKSEKTRIRNLVPLIEERLKGKGISVTVKNEKGSNGSWAFSTASGDLKFSVHFNAFNKKATGTECIYKKSGMKKHAAKMSKKVAAAIGVTDRGAKYRDDLYMMNIGFDLLLEVCFHDNKKDLEKYKPNMKAVADAIVEVIVDIVGGKADTGGSDKPSKPDDGKLDIDGSWGKDCTRKSQKVFKTTQDGIVSFQPASNQKYLANCYEGAWKFYHSGYDAGSELIRAIQKFLKDKGYYFGKIDGWCGKQTVIAIQKFLRAEGLYAGEIDGSMGPATVKAWQKYINSRL